ncbi:UPF0158 family protein [Clostridium thermarum]|uniref:UPF0158 family protein n=1 Tax=Clostridium thermarum TaxID=1716543 RepID=UPI0011200DA0|nr:UPF0158 family protein [Clostridium thermarum]
MNKLRVDLDLLLESFTFEKEGVCKEYLDTLTGEVINIPMEVAEAVENYADEEELEEWQRILMEDAQAIYDDKDGRYLSIPTIQDEFSNKLIADFVNNLINEEQLKEKFIKILKGKNSVSAFRSELYNYPNLSDLWHDFEEQRLKDNIVQWLKAFDIEVI